MRVFVTGASGWVGRGLVPELIAADHEVTALARSDAAAGALHAAGAEVRPGSLDDLDTLRDAAAAADGVVHLAFKHDIASPATSPAPPTPTTRRSRPSARPSPAPASRL